jgi:inosine-uridine nucleoside N-ribohydrolase
VSRKVLLIADPGIDTAFAIALALHDPDLDCIGLAASAGNVSAEQATKNAQVLVEQCDPPRRPRFGTALPAAYGVDATNLHGSNGLGGVEFPSAQLHHAHASDKLVFDLVRLYPNELTIVTLGPLTVLARALDRDPELASLIRRVVCVGGAVLEPGDASPVAEFHFFCDPEAARQVLHSGAPVTLVPLDMARKLLLSPTDLLNLPERATPACQFLGRIVTHGIGATASLYGVEGFHLNDVMGVAAVAISDAFSTRPAIIDVETRGELTRGMSVVDRRWAGTATSNVDLVTAVDDKAVRQYLRERLLNCD